MRGSAIKDLLASDGEGLASAAPPAKKTRRKKGTAPYLSILSNAKAFASAFDRMGIVSITDLRGRIVYANDAFLRISQYALSEIIGQDHSILNSAHHPKEFWAGAYDALSKGETWRAPIKNRAKDGSVYWVDALIVPFKEASGETKGFLSFQTDITAAVERHVAPQGLNTSPAGDQDTIGQLAHRDSLTGLPKRALFQERIRSGLAQVQNGSLLALHCLDLDRFKAINDTLGHPAGDALLKAVAERLQAEVRPSDTVARLGGDEFAIVQVAPRSIEDIEALAKRIIASFSEPFLLGENRVSVGTTIGIAVAPSDGSDAEQLMMNADMALYRTKSVGRTAFGFFEHSMHERLQTRHQIVMSLREAIANSKFELHYQPIVNVKSREIVGCEALIRLSHPVRGLIPASEFIPIAEECGLIGQIGDWVLKTACAEASLWPDNIWVAVNISPAQFRGQDLVDKVTSAAKGLPLSRLILEITETLLMKDRDIASDTLERLRKMGVRFAIDDFGTGFSSLSYLQSFPFDKIKIDRSFVSAIANVKRSATLRRSIIQLGYNLGMTSVAEGVESEDQLDRLRAEGCVEAQGFLFSRAVPAAKLRTLFSKPL